MVAPLWLPNQWYQVSSGIPFNVAVGGEDRRGRRFVVTPNHEPFIRAMVDATDASTIGIRDRALILLGFAGAFLRGIPTYRPFTEWLYGLPNAVLGFADLELRSQGVQLDPTLRGIAEFLEG
jgi:hypothetical protein